MIYDTRHARSRSMNLTVAASSQFRLPHRVVSRPRLRKHLDIATMMRRQVLWSLTRSLMLLSERTTRAQPRRVVTAELP